MSDVDEEHPLDLPPPPDPVLPEADTDAYHDAVDDGYDDEFYDQDDAS